MFTFRTESPGLNKAVTDGLTAIAGQLELGNQLKAREVLIQEELLRLLRRQCRPARPTGLEARLKREKENGMAADILTYGVTADAPTDPDVESRKIKVEVNGEVKRDDTVGSGVLDFGDIEVPQDSNVKITLVDIDDAGNPSGELVSEFVASDTIAPTAPTGLNVTLKGERENPDPPTEPPAEPAPPVEEPPVPPTE